ncbi:MAG: hypothetical protein H6918_06705 [Sphingomonadaceae bacterium]|nr:hypothetical protein [Sphingomonadaceae bacterium]
MRRLALLPGLLVAACSSGPEPEPQPQATEGAEQIDCAIGPGSEFGSQCLIEEVMEGETKLLVVRHPDGGFRRFEQLDDGRGLAVVDGADEAQTSYDDGVLEVTVGGDRYRFKAKARDAAGE